MNNKLMISICLATIATMSACASEIDVNDNNASNLNTVQQPLKPRNFGDIEGAAWSNSENNTSWFANNAVANGRFGNAMAAAYFRVVSSSYTPDIVASQTSLLTHGVIEGRWGNSNALGTTSFTVERSGDEADSFGYDIQAGNFCKGMWTSKRKKDILIASMPTTNSSSRQFVGGISIWGMAGAWRHIKDLKGTTNLGLAATKFAIGDLDNDGFEDIVYTSTPISEDYQYLPATVSVMSDICNTNSYLTPSDSISADSANYNLGYQIYIQNLSNTERPEIIIVDNLYFEPSSTVSQRGAIYFYQFIDGKLVQSRAPIYGDMKYDAAGNEIAGGQISSVAFSDIDGDGDLDLIVGEPYYQQERKREGIVRTYTNRGAGQDFDTTDMLWSASSGRSNAMFGKYVTISDLNNDGADDLIVAAPGIRNTGSDKAQAYVYVFLGSKDGKVFSKDPYWTHVSSLDTRINDAMGAQIIAAQLDNAGWKDLIIAAPDACTSTSQIDNIGRIDFMFSSTNECYTADKCLIGNKCYAANSIDPSSKCHRCNPSNDNFDWSPIVCADTGNACAVNSCDDRLGCVISPLNEGDLCGEVSCSGNTITTPTCVAGECKNQEQTCEFYTCSSQNVCLSSCRSDHECANGALCIRNKCTLSTSAGKPVIVLSDYASSVAPGARITLDASNSYDPDGDEISFAWWSPDITFALTNPPDTSSISFEAPASAGTYVVQLLVTDFDGLTSTRDIVFNVTAPKSSSSMRVLAPINDANIVAKDGLKVSGNAEPNQHVDVLLISDANTIAASCYAIASENGQWECSLADGVTTIPAGQYTVRATTQSALDPVTFDINVNVPNDIVANEDGKIQNIGCSITSHSAGFGWTILFAGLFLGLVPMRRRSRKA